MSKHRHHPSDEIPDVDYIKNLDTLHERTDVNVGMLFKFIVITTISAVLILFAMKALSNQFEKREASLEWPPASRVNPPGTRRLPPMPRLQGAPGNELLPLEDMQKFRREQNVALTSYGWVDRSAGVVHIPIAEAKRLIIERGLLTGAEPGPMASPAIKVQAASAGEASKRQ